MSEPSYEPKKPNYFLPIYLAAVYAIALWNPFELWRSPELSKPENGAIVMWLSMWILSMAFSIHDKRKHWNISVREYLIREHAMDEKRREIKKAFKKSVSASREGV